MIINISDKLRIISDPHQFILQEKKKEDHINEKGILVSGWGNLGYYAHISHVVLDVAETKLKQLGEMGLKEAIIEFLAIKQEIAEIVGSGFGENGLSASIRGSSAA